MAAQCIDPQPSGGFFQGLLETIHYFFCCAPESGTPQTCQIKLHNFPYYYISKHTHYHPIIMLQVLSEHYWPPAKDSSETYDEYTVELTVAE